VELEMLLILASKPVMKIWQGILKRYHCKILKEVQGETTLQSSGDLNE
jgi:hypothetical protein